MSNRIGRGPQVGSKRRALEVERRGEPRRNASLNRLRHADRFEAKAELRRERAQPEAASQVAQTAQKHEGFFQRVLELLQKLLGTGDSTPTDTTGTSGASSTSTATPAAPTTTDTSADASTTDDASAVPDSGTPVSTTTTPNAAVVGDSVASANNFFLTQLAGSQWNTSGGGAMDCGPTSALMALSSLGLVSHPDASSAASAIESFRGQVDDAEGLGRGAGGDNTAGVTVNGLRGAIEANGASTTDLSNGGNVSATLSSIDSALASGSKVIAYGDPSKAWESQLGSNYQEQGSFSHFVAVLGKADDGNYLVGDPLSKSGVIEATRSQLASYIQGGLNLSTPFGGAFAVSAQ